MELSYCYPESKPGDSNEFFVSLAGREDMIGIAGGTYDYYDYWRVAVLAGNSYGSSSFGFIITLIPADATC